MKTNHYLYSVLRRENKLKNFVIGIFRDLSSTPRLFIEIFTRENFGHRYFIFWGTMFWGISGLLVPVIIIKGAGAITGEVDFGKVLSYSFTWVAYFIAFIRRCLKHQKDYKKRNMSFYENRYSHYDGDVLPFVYKIQDRFFGKYKDRRILYIVCEPLPFFVGGLLLILLQQPIGLLLFFCSIIYALSYLGAFYQSDEYFWQNNDERIYNELLEDVFVNGKDHSRDRGVKYHGYRPSEEEIRKGVFKAMISGSDDEEEDIVSIEEHVWEVS